MVHYWRKYALTFICGKVPKPQSIFTSSDPKKVTCPACKKVLLNKGMVKDEKEK